MAAINVHVVLILVAVILMIISSFSIKSPIDLFKLAWGLVVLSLIV